MGRINESLFAASGLITPIYEPHHKKTGIAHAKTKTLINFAVTANQLRGHNLCGAREAAQRLCFRYIGSTIPLLHKSNISSL